MAENIPTGGGAAAGPAPKAAPIPNVLTLKVAGQVYAGWESIRVTRRLLGMPSDFDISLTERYPGQAAAIVVQPGQPCVVMLGGDPVITGYIDRYSASLTPTGHQVQIQGRSKCEDIVDCSVTPDQITGMQIVTSSLLDLATHLCAPYGITVTSLTGDNVPVSLPGSGAPLRFNAVLTESPYEIIERVARYASVLVYDDANGNLVIANVGTSKQASGFSQGVNVQAAGVTFSMDQRFSDYLPTLMSVNSFGSETPGGVAFPKAYDKGVPRFRQKIIVSEQSVLDVSLAEKRAQWEMARRFGQSQSIRVTCDNWRDSARALWTVNAFAPISLPALKLTPSEPWAIGEVTFASDLSRGTICDLLLMPKEAFQPEPVILTPFLNDPDRTPPVAGGGAAAAGSFGRPGVE